LFSPFLEDKYIILLDGTLNKLFEIFALKCGTLFFLIFSKCVGQFQEHP